MLPFTRIQGTRYFMQDNAPCHTVKLIKTWIADQGLKLLPRPPNSPDLNPIENLWCIIKRKVSGQPISSPDELKKKIKSVWVEEISTELCKKLVLSMPNCIAAVLNNGGYPCKY